MGKATQAFAWIIFSLSLKLANLVGNRNPITMTPAELPKLFSRFWTYQVGGWCAYFLLGTLSASPAFGSINQAALVHGVFAILGFTLSSGFHGYWRSRWDRSHPVSLLAVGGLFSVAASAFIMLVINLELRPHFPGAAATGGEWTSLFAGTTKYTFLFLAWVGLYVGGRLWMDAIRASETALTPSRRPDPVNSTAYVDGEHSGWVADPRDETLSYDDSIFIADSKEGRFLALSRITHITAEGSYTRIHEAKGPGHLIYKSLREWERVLDPARFKRVHRSHIVNLEYVSGVKPWFNYTFRIYLEGRTEPLEMSRRYAAELKFR